MSAALALKDFLTRGAAALPSSFAGYSRLTADEWAAVGPLVLAVLVALYAPFLVAEKLLRSSSRADTVHKLLTRGRRSVEQYKADPVPREAIARALECAIHAPNHFLTEPWRFRLLNDEQAARLTELSKFDGTKKLLDNCPQLLVVSIDMSPDGKNDGMEWNVRGLEDHAAAACAIQNMMLSLASQGIGSKWMTGKMGISGEDVLGIFNDVAETEHYMGTFMMGYPKEPMEHMKVRARKLGLSDGIHQVPSVWNASGCRDGTARASVCASKCVPPSVCLKRVPQVCASSVCLKRVPQACARVVRACARRRCVCGGGGEGGMS